VVWQFIGLPIEGPDTISLAEWIRAIAPLEADRAGGCEVNFAMGTRDLFPQGLVSGEHVRIWPPRPTSRSGEPIGLTGTKNCSATE
jgi:hypothetical protein